MSEAEFIDQALDALAKAGWNVRWGKEPDPREPWDRSANEKWALVLRCHKSERRTGTFIAFWPEGRPRQPLEAKLLRRALRDLMVV